jgi:membrane protein required for colicin V production
MNWLDIVIIIALAIPTLAGFMQGLIKTVLSLAGVIIGIVLAGNFYEPVSRLLGFISNEDIANVVAFILILVVIMIIAMILARVLKFLAKVTLLGWVDHIGGAAFGFLMGAILFSALLAALVQFFGDSFVTESLLAAIMLDKFPLILSLLPSKFNSIRDFFQ